MNIHSGVDSLIGQIANLQQKALRPNEDTTRWLDRYLNRSLGDLFPSPKADPEVKLSGSRRVLGYEYRTIEFRSEHLPLVDELVGDYLEHHTPLHRFKARKVSRSGFRPRRAVLHIHGWMEPGSILEDTLVGPLMTRGLDCDVFHFQLPHHGERQVRHSKYDGSLFFSADLMRTFESLRQSVLDARTLFQYVKNTGSYDEIGFSGISLGGVVTKVVACVEPRISFAVPIIGHLDLPDIIGKAPVLEGVRRELAGFGISSERVAELMDLVGLTRLMPAIAPERIVIVAAEDDLIVPADSMRRQIGRWPGVQSIWLKGGHMTALARLPGALPDLKKRLDTMSR